MTAVLVVVRRQRRSFLDDRFPISEEESRREMMAWIPFSSSIESYGSSSTLLLHSTVPSTRMPCRRLVPVASSLWLVRALPALSIHGKKSVGNVERKGIIKSNLLRYGILKQRDPRSSFQHCSSSSSYFFGRRSKNKTKRKPPRSNRTEPNQTQVDLVRCA